MKKIKKDKDGRVHTVEVYRQGEPNNRPAIVFALLAVTVLVLLYLIHL